jgi:hypothetical protein
MKDLKKEISEVIHDYARLIRRADSMTAQIALEEGLVNWVLLQVTKARKGEPGKDDPS